VVDVTGFKSAAGGLYPSGDDQRSTQIQVTGYAANIIIGAGGAMIRSFEQRSGCRIDILTGANSTYDRMIEFTGTEHSIANAKDLINAIIGGEVREDVPNSPDRKLLSSNTLELPETVEKPCYWTMAEEKEFPNLLAEFGFHWEGIAKRMGNKTHTMVRKYRPCTCEN